MNNLLLMNSLLNQNTNELIKIKRNCDSSHKHCNEIIEKANKFNKFITQEYFNELFTLFSQSRYSCCLSSSNNTKCYILKEFIIKYSDKFIISSWDMIINFMTDDEILKIIKNQIIIDPDFIINIINLDININYGGKINFLNGLINHAPKYKCFEYLIMLMNLEIFSKYLNKITKFHTTLIDNIIIKFITKNKDSLKLLENKDIGIKIMNIFSSRSSVLINIFPFISDFMSIEQKKDILNKSINTYDKDLLLLILENRIIIPDINTINKLVEKSYPKPEGSTDSKQIAEIIDLLCEYNLVIDKSIILKLLDHGCYVNNLEKYNLIVDSVILAKCTNLSFYPYKFDIVPTSDILKIECSKYQNLNTIKKLKEFGAKYTCECLEEACKISKNGKVIKYLINECNVKVTNLCLENFQETYKCESLDIIMKKYKLDNPSKYIENSEKKNYIEIDNNSTMTVTPKNIIIDIENNLIEYNLKNKIKKFFEYKKKTIKYDELYQLFLKYLIDNKLVIGKYFIINDKLSNLLKINHCVIMDIEQIYNILTYFIDSQIIIETNLIKLV
jgi:hypothetical protein